MAKIPDGEILKLLGDVVGQIGDETLSGKREQIKAFIATLSKV